MDSLADDRQLHGAIAARLQPLRPAAGREQAIRERLFERVGQSVQAHREYVTVRREEGEWQAQADGSKSRSLHEDESSRVLILCLPPGVSLRWPEGATAQEILVLEGGLAPAGDTMPLHGPHAYAVLRREDPQLMLLAVGATTIYVRQLLVEPDRLPGLEAHWWSLAVRPGVWVDPARRRWHQTSDGVLVLPLCGDSQVVSMLVRFAAGASVADHRHELNEDCLVLEGEMFLGDILLRAGDYQLAPAGGSHFGEMSDVGVLFFFHGALDPVLRGKPSA
jgi:anti-sigma factor ChrR (cupin superfamily)